MPFGTEKHLLSALSGTQSDCLSLSRELLNVLKSHCVFELQKLRLLATSLKIIILGTISGKNLRSKFVRCLKFSDLTFQNYELGINFSVCLANHKLTFNAPHPSQQPESTHFSRSKGGGGGAFSWQFFIIHWTIDVPNFLSRWKANNLRLNVRVRACNVTRKPR